MLKIPALTLFFICVHRTFSLTDGGADIKILNSNATWLINDPLSFHGGNEKGVMQDVRNDREWPSERISWGTLTGGIET